MPFFFKGSASTNLDDALENTNVRNNKKQYQDITAVVKDDYFWAFAELIHLIDNVMDWLSSWAGGCACHENLVATACNSRPARNRLVVSNISSNGRANVDFRSCPMKGRRAPEVAGGVLHRQVYNAISEAKSDVLLIAQSYNLSPDLSARLRLSFEIAQQRLLLGIRLKLACWQQVPWILPALASHDRETTVLTARAVLRMWGKWSDKQQANCICKLHSISILPSRCLPTLAITFL